MEKEPAGNTVNSASMSYRFVTTAKKNDFIVFLQFLIMRSLPLFFFTCMKEGDHIGLMHKASGALHFYINGIDQGEAQKLDENKSTSTKTM